MYSETLSLAPLLKPASKHQIVAIILALTLHFSILLTLVSLSLWAATLPIQQLMEINLIVGSQVGSSSPMPITEPAAPASITEPAAPNLDPTPPTSNATPLSEAPLTEVAPESTPPQPIAETAPKLKSEVPKPDPKPINTTPKPINKSTKPKTKQAQINQPQTNQTQTNSSQTNQTQTTQTNQTQMSSTLSDNPNSPSNTLTSLPNTGTKQNPLPFGGQHGPAFKHQVMPEYPIQARRQGITGQVRLQILINAEGKVQEIQVQSSSADILTQAAIQAVNRSSFKPFAPKGIAISCWTILPIEFKLKN